jgi:predicted Zn-dependent protease
MRRLLLAGLLLACPPAFAQLNLNQMLDLGRKALETGKKVNEATRDFTTDEEVQLGEGVTASFLGAAPLHPDASLQAYVNRVGKWLALHSDRPDLPWTFGVIDTETVNAFAMPGGTVLVSSGLLKRLSNESELAGVLAHEIAHVVKKHQLKAIQSAAGTDVLADLGKEAASRKIGGSGALGFSKSGLTKLGIDAVKDGAYLRPLDRAMEYEADRLGVLIAARSGYDPFGLAAALQMLAQVKPEEAAILFSTHPAPADRLAELEKFSPTLEKYASQPQVEARFRQNVR